VVALADVVGSTTQIINAAVNRTADTFIVATDNGILHKMRAAAPGKRFIEAPTAGNSATCKSCAHCPWMAMNGLQNLADLLENMETQRQRNPRRSGHRPAGRDLDHPHAGLRRRQKAACSQRRSGAGGQTVRWNRSSMSTLINRYAPFDEALKSAFEANLLAACWKMWARRPDRLAGAGRRPCTARVIVREGRAVRRAVVRRRHELHAGRHRNRVALRRRRLMQADTWCAPSPVRRAPC
jgi:hypothetical protein